MEREYQVQFKVVGNDFWGNWFGWAFPTTCRNFETEDKSTHHLAARLIDAIEQEIINPKSN